jgi:hypothetical protein
MSCPGCERRARLPGTNPNFKRPSSGILDSQDIRNIGNFAFTSGSSGGSPETWVNNWAYWINMLSVSLIS